MKVLSRFAKPIVLLFASVCVAYSADAKGKIKSADLFQLTNIWHVHLAFSKSAWEALEPKNGGGFFGRPRGPGAAMFLAPAFLRADADADSKISTAEWAQLGESWFSAWDTTKSGKVTEDQLREGLNKTLTPQGSPGFRMNLQGAEGKRNGVAAAMAGIDYEYVKADFDFEQQHFTNVAVRYKGNGTYMASRGADKRSLKIDLNDYVKGQKLAGMNKLNLHNNVTDASWMNEVLSHKLFRDAAVPAPRTTYAKVFVTVDGNFQKKYFGLYTIVENVDDEFADDHFGSKKGGIFKPVTPDLFAYLGEDWARYNQTYDPKDSVTPEQKQRIIDLCKLVTKSSDLEFNQQIGNFIDLEEFARYMAVLVYLADLDGILGPGQNLYLHLDAKTQKISFIPWDLDHSFGQFGMRGTQVQRENLSIEKPWQGENRFLQRVFKNEQFHNLYRARLTEFSESLFKPERFNKQVDEIAATIRPAVQAESEQKLQRFDSVVAGKSVEPGTFGRGPGGPGGGFPIPLVGYAKPIKPFVQVRSQSIADQLTGKSKGETIGELAFRRPGGEARSGAGMFMSGAFMTKLDSNKDGVLTQNETVNGFNSLFKKWDVDHKGIITEEQLRAALDGDFVPSPREEQR